MEEFWIKNKINDLSKCYSFEMFESTIELIYFRKVYVASLFENHFFNYPEEYEGVYKQLVGEHLPKDIRAADPSILKMIFVWLEQSKIVFKKPS